MDKVDTLDTVGWTLVDVHDLLLLANTLSLQLVIKVFQLTALCVCVCVSVSMSACMRVCACVRA